jgi:dTDP-4-dehydrorhamnose 3,5-epimerase-like enzyme
MEEPRLIGGQQYFDDRGCVVAGNDFNPSEYKRAYVVRNNKLGFVRAWHAHKNEAKLAHVVQGCALICAVLIDDWDHPGKEQPAFRCVVPAGQMLHIPAGYANGFMNLTEDTIVQFFSTATLEESKADDYRYPARYWDLWQIEER